MRGRNLLMLTALVAVLAGYIWFFERHQPTSDEASQLAKKLFPEPKKPDIQMPMLSCGSDGASVYPASVSAHGLRGGGYT